MSLGYSNATLSRVDQPAVSGGGDITFPTPGNSLAFRCTVDAPTTSQKWRLQEIASDATAVLYIEASSVSVIAAGVSASPPEAALKNARLLVTLDSEEAPRQYMVRDVGPRLGGLLQYYEVFAKSV